MIASWFFPPANTMGALRTGRLADYLVARGHDVRVLSARDVPVPQTLASPFAEDRTLRTRWVDVRAPLGALARLRRSVRGRVPPAAAESAKSAPTKIAKPAGGGVTALYQNLFCLPDQQIGWLPFAWHAGRGLGAWRPDLIFATAPPFTSLLLGRMLAARFRVPWVAEMRDRWSDDPYDDVPAWRRHMDRWLEHRVLGHCSAIVTVSEPWAATYRSVYGKPAIVAYNGFIPEEFGEHPVEGRTGEESCVIVYTGRIYPGRRDPTPLFEAIARLDNSNPGVRVEFYGCEPGQILPLARACGVADAVSVFPHRPHKEILAIQAGADILLLLQWNDPREQGNVPGKVFEYLAARRPILGLGLAEGVPARIIRERGAGIYANEPEAIARQLEIWRAAKRRDGRLAPLPASVAAGFSRPEQCGRIEQLLGGLVAGAELRGEYTACET